MTRCHGLLTVVSFFVFASSFQTLMFSASLLLSRGTLTCYTDEPAAPAEEAPPSSAAAAAPSSAAEAAPAPPSEIAVDEEAVTRLAERETSAASPFKLYSLWHERCLSASVPAERKVLVQAWAELEKEKKALFIKIFRKTRAYCGSSTPAAASP